MSVQLTALDGGSVTIPDERLEELSMMFHGPLVGPGDAEYDSLRVVHNGAIDRNPGLIIRCSGAADVVDAVNLAREHGVLTAVRGGGHSIAGHSICDGGLMIDLSAMRGVWVDPDARVVRVQGGAVWGDVDREAQAFGLCVPGGVVSTTGVAGLTLGGGIGWVHRKWGLSCDSLRSVEIVTADGQRRRVSEAEEPDLFWALRGGGGNFGVVTEFEFDAYPLGPIVYQAAPMWAADDAPEIFAKWRDWAGTVPDEVTTRAVFWTMPAAPVLPPEVHDRKVLITAAVWAGDPEQGQKELQPLRELGTPLADPMSAAMPYRMVQSAFDPFFPKGEIHSYWKSTYLDGLSDHASELIVKHGLERPTPLTLVHVPLLGGAVSAASATDTAFGDRSAPFMLSIDANSPDPGDFDSIRAWTRGAISDANNLQDSRGTYLNFSGDEELDPGDREAAWGPNLDRLRSIKQQYDPDNLFRLNNNIPPT